MAEDAKAAGTTGRRKKKAADHAGFVTKVRDAGWIKRKDGKDAWRGELWRGVVRIDGTRYEVYGPKEGAAMVKLDALKTDLTRGTYQKPDNRTVADLLVEYIADGKDRGLKPKTLFFYEQMRSLYFGGAIAHVKLHELRPEHVHQWVRSMTAKGLGSTTIRNTRAVLNAALEFAVRQEWTTRNVCHSVKPPKRIKPKLRPPTPDEMDRLIESAEAAGDPLAALWTLAAYAGCRPGELLALRWQDVDLKGGYLTIAQNQTKLPKQAIRFASTKTDRVRRVRIVGDALGALAGHRVRQLEGRLAAGADYDDHDLVFCFDTGAPLPERGAVYRFKLALQRADLPREIRFYDMRHGNATAMLLSGVQPKAAATRLGHTSVQLFNDTYAHMLDEIDSDAAAKLQGVIGGRRRSAS